MTTYDYFALASAALVAHAPSAVPAPCNVTPALASAFRKWRFWEMQGLVHLGAGTAHCVAENSLADLLNHRISQGEWEAYLGVARAHADR